MGDIRKLIEHVPDETPVIMSDNLRLIYNHADGVFVFQEVAGGNLKFDCEDYIKDFPLRDIEYDNMFTDVPVYRLENGFAIKSGYGDTKDFRVVQYVLTDINGNEVVLYTIENNDGEIIGISDECYWGFEEFNDTINQKYIRYKTDNISVALLLMIICGVMVQCYDTDSIYINKSLIERMVLKKNRDAELIAYTGFRVAMIESNEKIAQGYLRIVEKGLNATYEDNDIIRLFLMEPDAPDLDEKLIRDLRQDERTTIRWESYLKSSHFNPHEAPIIGFIGYIIHMYEMLNAGVIARNSQPFEER